MYLGRIVEIAPAQRPLRRAAAPLHRGAAVGGADPGPDGEAPAHPAAGRRAEPDPPAVGLPFPHPLPDPRAAAVQHGEAAVAADRRRPLGGVSPARIVPAPAQHFVRSTHRINRSVILLDWCGRRCACLTAARVTIHGGCRCKAACRTDGPRTEALRRALRRCTTRGRQRTCCSSSIGRHSPRPDIAASLRASQIRRANPALAAEIHAELTRR